MKKVIVFITLVLAAANVLAGVLITEYHLFNAIATSMALLLTGGLLYVVTQSSLRDAFKVSYTFLFIFIGLVIYLLMLVSKPQMQDNWCIITSVLLIVFEAVILYIAIWVSKRH